MILELKFTINNPKMLHKVCEEDWEPVGEYWIYQRNSWDYQYWSYNLYYLKQIRSEFGGIILNKNGIVC